MRMTGIAVVLTTLAISTGFPKPPPSFADAPRLQVLRDNLRGRLSSPGSRARQLVAESASRLGVTAEDLITTYDRALVAGVRYVTLIPSGATRSQGAPASKGVIWNPAASVVYDPALSTPSYYVVDPNAAPDLMTRVKAVLTRANTEYREDILYEIWDSITAVATIDLSYLIDLSPVNQIIGTILGSEEDGNRLRSIEITRPDLLALWGRDGWRGRSAYFSHDPAAGRWPFMQTTDNTVTWLQFNRSLVIGHIPILSWRVQGLRSMFADELHGPCVNLLDPGAIFLERLLRSNDVVSIGDLQSTPRVHVRALLKRTPGEHVTVPPGGIALVFDANGLLKSAGRARTTVASLRLSCPFRLVR